MSMEGLPGSPMAHVQKAPGEVRACPPAQTVAYCRDTGNTLLQCRQIHMREDLSLVHGFFFGCCCSYKYLVIST